MILAAALMPTAVSAATLPQAQVGSGSSRGRCADCSTTREERARRDLLLKLDSLRWEFEHERLSEKKRERLEKEMVLAVRALEESLGEVRGRRATSAETRRAVAAARAWPSTPAATVEMTRGPRMRGYLGVTFDGPNTYDMRDNEHVIRFYAYPRIALVELSSPAERAGIRQGDTLLALNGIDVVAREISLTKMLVPKEQLTVRLVRDGSARDVKVTVGETPEYVMRRTPLAAARAPLPPEPMGAVGVRTPPPVAHAAPPPMAPSVSAVWVYNDGIGGAKVETVTEGLGKALGVKSGVLVVRVGNGTMAHESGLRDGDVILRAAGHLVSTVRDLRVVLAGNEDESAVKLVILRERRQREITLRW